MIRGRIGSDVYSVGKDGKGNRQQVIRSLAVQVSNPRTTSQMFGRMVMSTVMQAVSALRPIIDHSFDGTPTGQPSISEFIRINYAKVKADAVAHPADGNYFGLKKYGEKGIAGGKYQISNGELVASDPLYSGINGIMVALTTATKTVGGLKAAWNVGADGFVTFVCINPDGTASYFRARFSTALADDTALTTDNVKTMFTFEGNVTPTATIDGNRVEITISITDDPISYGIILSDKVNGAWKHSTCELGASSDLDFASDVALPTYPVGSEQFLNGGDL